MNYYLLKPKWFDLEKYKDILTVSELEQIRIFIHYLVLRNFHVYKKIVHQNIKISKKFLESKIFNWKSKSKLLNFLENELLLIKNNWYSYGVEPECKKFRLNYRNEFKADNYIYEFKGKVNRKKFLDLFTCDIPKEFLGFEFENDKKQLNFINKLELNKNEFENILPNYKDKQDNYLEILENDCLNFNSKKTFSKYDDFSNRYYHFLSNKPEKVRNCFELNGKKLASLDIKSSQIYFFTQLDKIDLSHYNLEASKINLEASFKDLVLNNDIYIYFANELNISREKAKKQLLAFFYGDKRKKKISNILKNNFPRTFKTIIYLQNLQTNNSKFNFTKIIFGNEIEKKTYFNYLLQSIERNIFLKAFEYKKDFYTIHDSICFQAERKEEFKICLNEYILSKGLDLPKLK